MKVSESQRKNQCNNQSYSKSLTLTNSSLLFSLTLLIFPRLVGSESSVWAAGLFAWHAQYFGQGGACVAVFAWYVTCEPVSCISYFRTGVLMDLRLSGHARQGLGGTGLSIHWLPNPLSYAKLIF